LPLPASGNPRQGSVLCTRATTLEMTKGKQWLFRLFRPLLPLQHLRADYREYVNFPARVGVEVDVVSPSAVRSAEFLGEHLAAFFGNYRKARAFNFQHTAQLGL